MTPNHIIETAFPLQLHPIPENVPNRFVYALAEVHGGQATSFLAEFQFAFASWYVNPNHQAPLQRWVHLVQAIYNAGERNMAQNPHLFSALVDAMMAQHLHYLVIKRFRNLSQKLTMKTAFQLSQLIQ